MHSKTIKILLCYLSPILFSNLAFAGWPSFEVLSPETITSTLLVHNGCPADEEKIPVGTKILIKSRYIPRDQMWYWLYEGNSECHKIHDNLEYIGFHQTNHYTGGIIDTIYGTPNNPLFHFIFTIPGPYWYCGNLIGPNPPQIIDCAADMYMNKSN